MYIERPKYMVKLEGFIDTPVAKVLTGLRRSGKSALLAMLRERLLSRGVYPQRILTINFDELENASLRDPFILNDYITAQAPEEGPYYVFLDEIQEVPQWERVVNSLIAHGQADIYVTGSNSTLLSSELATYIAGRYVSFEVAPLNFGEFVEFSIQTGHQESSMQQYFSRYLVRGGFPGLFASDYTEEQARQMTQDIYSSILIRDVIGRKQIRSVELFERVALYALDNIGNIFSANRVSTYLKSQGKVLSHQTVADYLAALTEAYALRKVTRYNLRGRAHLETGEKYYAGDHGLVNAAFGFSRSRIPGLLENIVQAEMRSRGYKVFVGRMGEAEVDFIGERQGETIYIQVSMSILDETTMAREFAPLLAIKDSYPKYVVSMDDFAGGNVQGVRSVRIWDFLLDETW